jgi:hypothetical protein
VVLSLVRVSLNAMSLGARMVQAVVSLIMLAMPERGERQREAAGGKEGGQAGR